MPGNEIKIIHFSVKKKKRIQNKLTFKGKTLIEEPYIQNKNDLLSIWALYHKKTANIRKTLKNI